MRTLSAESANPFVSHDKEVDIVRFAINSGFADIALDGQVALRVMYQRPGESEVRAQTLTYYDTDGLHNYYDWQLSQSDLAKNGSLMVALCILDISGGEVSEWHTTPCAVRVLSTIHTDDSDEGDDTITPTVKERVAVLETMIQRVASGAPIVVSSASAMTDTDQIYVLSTDGMWYYYNGSAWTVGGEYGAVSTDTTLTQSGIPADAKVVGDEITTIKADLNIINPTANITWELGKGIDTSGNVNNNQYTALSNDIPCEPGDFFITTSPTVDANNKFLVYYIIQYNGDTFISRTEFTSLIRSIVIGDNTTKIRVAFGRYGSSQTPISQQDITNYVAIKFVRKSASKADTNLQFRNTVLNKYTDIGTGINDIAENSFVFSPEGTANNPTTTGGYFIQTILYNTNGTAAMQIAYKYDSGLCYYRRKVNGSWRSWILNSAPANPTSPLYYAFGDSLTYGAVWTPKEESPYYQIAQASLINQIPTRIANAIGAASSFANKGVGGAYFVGTGTNKIITAIQNQDLSNAKIITIAGGRNDSENTLGDKTSTSGDGTICGAIREILDYVTTNYKKLQIVWIGVTPNTSTNATVFTRVFAGGWSLNSFDEKVAELCAEYSVPYVNWKMCTYMRHWADYSGAGQVYSHPNNEESYMQMGNYIAGQVAQYYRG